MHRIGFLISDGFQIMALAAQSVFEYANMGLEKPFYAMDNYSVDGGDVRSSLGLPVATRALRGRIGVDTWIVAGVNDPLAAPAPAGVVAYLRRANTRARRIAGICTGAFVLAEAVHLSPRQFSRIFTLETGQSPAKAIERLRLEAARLMIEQSRHPLDVIAQENGFRDRRHMREAFVRGFGVPPQALRRDARADERETG
jgi:transcriptional regulator GlxA family with amidase domain